MNEGNAPGGQQGFQRTAVQKSDDRPLDDQTSQSGHEETQRVRQKEIAFVEPTGGIEARQVQTKGDGRPPTLRAA